MTGRFGEVITLPVRRVCDLLGDQLSHIIVENLYAGICDPSVAENDDLAKEEETQTCLLTLSSASGWLVSWSIAMGYK